jgi:hypothetical protein
MRRITLAAAIILWASILSISASVAEGLPIPPLPPANPPLGEIAPVPHVDSHAPVAQVSDSPSIDVKFFHVRRYDPSLGFAPGSRYETNEDRRPIQPPGFTVNVPLK